MMSTTATRVFPNDLTLQFVGRKADVALFENLGIEDQQPLRGNWLSLEDSPGLLCTGISKLVQWIIIELLSEYGQDLYEPERGTKLMPLLQQGWFLGTVEAMQAVSLAIPAVERAVSGISEFADEDLESLQVLKVEPGPVPGVMSLYLQVNSRDGDQREVILPLSGAGLVTE
jgi:hypothetical protein